MMMNCQLKQAALPFHAEDNVRLTARAATEPR
jgi:hypothetical protein